MQKVLILDRCDNFYQVFDFATGDAISERLASRSAAADWAAQRGFEVVAQ